MQSLEKNDIHPSITPDAIAWLAELGFDPQFGARPLKRVIQRKVLNELSKMIIGGQVHKESGIVVDVFDKEIVFYNPSATTPPEAGPR